LDIFPEEKTMPWKRHFLIVSMGLTILSGYHRGFAQVIAAADTAQKQVIATIPQSMNYQGFLSDSKANPVTGSVVAKISLWNAETGGQMLWQEQVIMDIRQGYFTVELGKSTPLTRLLFDNTPRWLQMSVDSDVLSPRKQVLAVPMAMQAENATLFNNLSVEQFYLRSQADDHAKNKIDAASLGGIAAAEFLSKPQLEINYISRQSINSVTSEMIVDGAISRQDIGFQMGIGTITAVNPGLGLSGGGVNGEVSLGLSTEYITGQIYDSRFLRKNEGNAITYTMMADESVGSSQIRNGSVMPADLGFPIGSIAQIAAGVGLSGGGTSGVVTLSLNSDYQSGVAFDSRFVNNDEENSITGKMIKDGDITGFDIKNNSITQEDMAFEMGDITAVHTVNGLVGGKVSGEVSLQLAPNYLDGSAYDQRFARRDQATVTSDMIIDGAIQPRDMGFLAGDVTGVLAGPGLRVAGSGLSGDITVQLDNPYLSGESFDPRFVKRTDANAVSSVMIIDGGVGSMDLADNAVQERHLLTPLVLSRSNNDGALLSIRNMATHPNSMAVEGRGYTGIKGYGSQTGVFGEGDLYGVRGLGLQTGVYGVGDLYGVYAQARNTSNPSAYGLFVEGRARCTNGTWSDVAEYVLMSETVQAGDVVVIDAGTSHSVKKCSKPYDTAVAGVISTNPTIMVGGLVKQGTPLALTGIVPCKVSTENGPIQAGDLLTTSSTAGHAMKATDRRTGTVIGKAIESLSSGTGVIQVLVMLM
jgi:hypothetical protein